MRISDFNTTGLTGAKKAYMINPWQSLIKSAGISDKYDSLGGSYGIGKSAPFACSDIRTVFYTSYDTEGVLASQGVSRLISFPIEDDKNTQSMGYQISIGGPAKWKVESTERFTQGIGYYGETEKNTPFFSELNMDTSFKRNGITGTDLYIVGFLEDSKWKEELVVAILDNFLIAIYNKNLVVKIDNITISAGTLKDIIENFNITKETFSDRTQTVLSMLENKTGSPYDVSLLFSTLCRASDIPCMPISGVITDEDKTYLHWWAEFYIDAYGWVPVDIGMALDVPFESKIENRRTYYFGNLDGNRISFSHGEKEILPMTADGKIYSRERNFALQSFWEEALNINSYTCFWHVPQINKIN